MARGRRLIGPPRARCFGPAQAWHDTVAVGPGLARPDPRAVPWPPPGTACRPGLARRYPIISIFPIKTQTLPILSSRSWFSLQPSLSLLPHPIPLLLRVRRRKHRRGGGACDQRAAVEWPAVASEQRQSDARWPASGGGAARGGQ